jgi:hypothetical protein
MTTVPAPAAFSMGRVISRLFGVLQRNVATFLLLSLLLVGLPTAVIAFAQLSVMTPLMSGAAPGDTQDLVNSAFAPMNIVLGVAGFLATVIGNAVLQGAVIHASVRDLSGNRASFGEALGTGARFFLPLLCIGLIVGICCAFGFLIFVIPGLLLGLAWFVAAPAEVVERTGIFGSLGRSVVLTRNNRFAILGLCVIYVLGAWFIQAAISGSLSASLAVGAGAAGAASPGGQPPGFQGLLLAQSLISVVLSTVFASISSAGVASVYFELRQTKEGVGIDQLAALFD